MTDLQKVTITQMRSNGMSFGQISAATSIPASTIRTFCRRQDIKVETAANAGGFIACKCCGRLVEQDLKRKQKKFCSDKCRMTWWNNNLDKVNRKAVYEFACAYCKKPFTAYGNKGRKYCSHECYIRDRFGGGADE